MVTWSMMIKLARGRRKRIVFVVAFFSLIRSVTWGWKGSGLAIEQLGSRGSIYGNRIGGKKWNLTLSLSLHQLQLPFLFVALFCLHFDTNCSHCCKFVSFLFCYSYSAEKSFCFCRLQLMCQPTDLLLVWAAVLIAADCDLLQSNSEIVKEEKEE